MKHVMDEMDVQIFKMKSASYFVNVKQLQIKSFLDENVFGCIFYNEFKDFDEKHLDEN